MVRLTNKDIAAQHDPRRYHVLPPPQIAGTVDGDESALSRAYTHVDSVQRRECRLGVTPLVVQRLTVLGVANDINYLVRGLAIAMRDKVQGQLLLLPPIHTPEGRNAKWSGDRTSLVTGRSIDRVWHWLDGLPGTSHRTVFWPSACQERLEDRERDRLLAFDRLSRNSTIAIAAAHMGLGSNVIDAAMSTRMLARGMPLTDIPLVYRDHGVLWWWQVLTTYTVRVRGVLAQRVRHHPALLALLDTCKSRRESVTTRTQSRWLHVGRQALSRATGGASSDLGWAPSLAFDAGLHVRMGDACGPRARRHQMEVRKCIPTLREGLAPLIAQGVVPQGGRLFLATDSPQIAEEAKAAAASLPFEVHFLAFNRSKYDTEAWIELASAAARSQIQILEETLLDLLLLSRARFIAGSMYGNVPRLALQLRPTTPGDSRRLAYITTDGRDWCSKPTCMSNNTPTGRFW